MKSVPRPRVSVLYGGNAQAGRTTRLGSAPFEHLLRIVISFQSGK
jgi:hypothetical protein